MLQVTDLSFGFTNKPLIDRLNFTARSGELWLIAGPNGTGKSTLMSIIAGLRAPNSGSVTWTDGGASACETRFRSDYLAAEANGHFLKLDAETNLNFWSRLRAGNSLPKATLDSALARWRLDHPLVRRDLAIEEFSTGMKRRLAMARLEVNAAPLWLLDEPLFGLDTEGIQTFVSALASHQQRGGVALIVSHDLNSLQSLSLRKLDAESFRGRKA